MQERLGLPRGLERPNQSRFGLTTRTVKN